MLRQVARISATNERCSSALSPSTSTFAFRRRSRSTICSLRSSAAIASGWETQNLLASRFAVAKKKKIRVTKYNFDLNTAQGHTNCSFSGVLRSFQAFAGKK